MFFKAKENISPHDFKYVRNPHEFCTDVDQVDLLVMIASASWQFDRRKIIRETWATQTGNGKAGFKVLCEISYMKTMRLHLNKLWNHRQNLKYLFFIGNDGKPDNHRKLDQEFEEYGDIVEEDFQENYYNLTLKTIGQLKWATHYCPNMKYGLHIDDDVFGQAKGYSRSNMIRQNLGVVRAPYNESGLIGRS